MPHVKESLGVSPPADGGPPTQPEAWETPLESSRAIAVSVTMDAASFETTVGDMVRDST